MSLTGEDLIKTAEFQNCLSQLAKGSAALIPYSALTEETDEEKKRSTYQLFADGRCLVYNDKTGDKEAPVVLGLNADTLQIESTYEDWFPEMKIRVRNDDTGTYITVQAADGKGRSVCFENSKWFVA